MTEKTTNAIDRSKLLDLVPLSRFSDFFPAISVGSLRQLVFYNTHGFADKVIRRIGSRIYVKISAFQEWIEETNRKQAV